jgi:ribosomal protein L19
MPNGIALLEKIAARPAQKFTRMPAIRAIGQQQPPTLVEKPLVLKDKGLMDTLRSEYRQKLDGVEAKWTLFKRNSPNYTPAGSTLTVSYHENTTSNRLCHFRGFLIGIRRHLSSPTIILRGVVENLPVEQVFQIFSPLIKEITCDKKATLLKGRKLYWVRDNPAWIPKFTSPSNQNIETRSPIPPRLHDVLLRGRDKVKSDQRHGIFYQRRKINKRKK